MTEERKKTAVVIGGGAAGMMAAIAIKESCGVGAEVILIERNSYLGAKVLLSGGGRCNVTTGIADARKLLENYPRGAKFLMSAMFRFPPAKVMEWFESRGVPLKTENDLRVFPVSDEGAQIVGALERVLHNSGVKVMLNSAVSKVAREGEGFLLEMGSGQKISADLLVITTGGVAYKQTGSSGDGFGFAESLGHTITPLAPSLGALEVKEPWIGELAGVSFEKAELTLTCSDEVKKYGRTGAFVFTHKGVSGPAVFALSAMAAHEVCSKESPMLLSINLFPEEDAQKLKMRLQKAIETNGKKKLFNFIDMFLPKSLCGVFVKELGLPEKMTAGNLNKEQREAIQKKLQNFSLHVTGRGTGDEFVTAGGVDPDQINSGTMESKLCPGLYFAGEILDVDGFTGGFNLQAAWATGRLAGESAAKKFLEALR